MRAASGLSCVTKSVFSYETRADIFDPHLLSSPTGSHFDRGSTAV